MLGRGLQPAPPREEYAATVGSTRAYIEREDGSEAGDPAKAASAIVSALDADDPPLRLPLGGDAVDAIRAKHDAQHAELARWEAVARATAFD